MSYRLPDDLTKTALVGCRVVVPLRNKKCIGLIWQLQDEKGDPGLKEVREIIDARPIISPAQKKFAEWLSKYYYTPLPSVLRLFLPRALMQPDNLLIYRTDKDVFSAEKWEEDYLNLLQKNRPLKVNTLKKKLDNETDFYSRLAQLEEKGYLTISYKRSSRRVISEQVVNLIVSSTESLKLGFKQKLVVSYLKRAAKPQKLSKLTRKLKVSRRSIEALGDRRIVSITPLHGLSEKKLSVQESMLNREQMEVAESISASIKDQKFKVYLLHGVTGSGKTEVYVKLIWDALELGKTALVLQPEITLSEQVYSKLSTKFGDRVCRLHSNITDSRKYSTFKGIESGEIQVVIGPRSALFSPLRNIGLIIVDEEHDSSYKQGGSTPFYQGRDAAVVWGRLNRCPVLLGSATPSVESWGNVKTGKYQLLKLTERWDRREMPEVKLVVFRPESMDAEPLSEYLSGKIAENLMSGAQTVLFLNRRGFAPTVKCSTCGATLRCPNCDVGLVYHLSHENVMCHLCGFQSNLIDTCPACGGTEWGYFGAGTQRIEYYLKRKFPSALIGRLDLDTAANVGSTKKLLSKFAASKLDILIGTQMVAKGLDFPGVRLVGILSADASLNMPDFRAAEKTYALLFQASGRAGRGKYPGEVVIQVESDDFPLMHITKESNFSDFLDEEYERRIDLSYPPHRHLIMIKLKSGSAERVERASFEFQKRMYRLRRKYERYMTVLGPAPAPFFKVKNNYRWRILIKTSSVKSSLAFIDRFLQTSEIKSIMKNIRLLIDVDPYDMM